MSVVLKVLVCGFRKNITRVQEQSTTISRSVIDEGSSTDKHQRS